MSSRFRAVGMSRADIRRVAQAVRDVFGLAQQPYFPIVQVLESALDRLVPGFAWDIREKQDLGADHGLTDHCEKVILIREDVYLGAVAGNGRDRGTVAHEIGHAILHAPARLARRMPDSPEVPTYCCPEWQAKAFAGELLVDCRQLAQGDTVYTVASRFGVSLDSARVQLKAAESFKRGGHG